METDSQHCQVCQRPPDEKLPFYCHRCARNAIHDPRINLASTLLMKENLGKEIEATVNLSKSQANPNEFEATADQEGAKKLEYNNSKSEYRLTAARTQIILDDSRRLQEQIEDMRTRIADKKTSLAKRRRALKSANSNLRYEEDTSVKTLNEAIISVRPAWDRVHNHTVNARHVLPREIVALYGLQRVARRGNTGRDVFVVAGVPVFNLKELNCASPEHLNASTYHVAHLIHLISHYLGLRLPAEISLATAGQPQTIIYPPMSSYKADILSFGPGESSLSKTAPRKRVLWLEKPLPQLYSEDSQAYSFYLDAIILLAWNVAWVAKTQGIDVGGGGWEEICYVGRNLWNLSGHGDELKSPVKRATAMAKEDKATPPTEPSSFSQASSHSFLNSNGSNGAAGMMKTWKYSIPTRIIDTVKSALMNERMGADWEVLEKPEEEETAAGEEGPATSTKQEEQGKEPNSSDASSDQGWTNIRS